MPVDLDVTLALLKNTAFSFMAGAPEDQIEAYEAIIPRVYGNWLDPNVEPLNSPEVDTPGVLLDPTTVKYAINDGPVGAARPLVMWNGEIQEDIPAVYDFNPAELIEGRLLATLTFKLNVVREGIVSVRHAGSLDGSGQPITNPILMLADLLVRYAGWTLDYVDVGTCYQTMTDMQQLGYPAHYCFHEDLTIREYLRDLLPAYHTDFLEDGNGRLAVILDRSLTPLPVSPAYHIPAYEVVDHGSPATALVFEAHSDDVANQVLLHGRHNWSQGQTTQDYLWDYAQSQSAYGAAYGAEFTYRNMYTLAHATQWLNSFAMLHGFEPRTVTFTMKGLKGIPLIPPRFITMEWPALNWVQHLLKVKSTAIRWSRREVQLTCIDCQRELTDTIDSPQASPTQRRRQMSRTYNWPPGSVGDLGQLPTAPPNTRNECANGGFELGDNGQWDFKVNNAVKQWTVVDAAGDAYRGRFYARLNRNQGNTMSVSLRTRIDPGEWVLVSAWFREDSTTTGEARAVIHFYNQADQFLSTTLGNFVIPTTAYMESIVVSLAPGNAYYYRPGIYLPVPPGIGAPGTWRADEVRAVSGSLAELMASRQGSTVTRNFVLNGDFEAGSLMWALEGGWEVTNYPFLPARSGLWFAAHQPTAVATEEHLIGRTLIAVTAAQTFTLQVWVITIGTPNGVARLGVNWLNGQQQIMASNATAQTPGPFATYFLGSGSMTVPAGAVYAQVWLGVQGHSVANTFWVFDDMFLSIG